MSDSLNSDPRSSLLFFLTNLQTRNNEPCSWFRISQDPELVRISRREMEEEFKQKIFYLDKPRLLEFILKKSKEELETEHESNHIAQKTKKALSNLQTLLESLLEKCKDTLKTTEEFIATLKTKKYTEFLQNIDDPLSANRLDLLLASEATRKLTGSIPRLKKHFTGVLGSLENDFLSKIIQEKRKTAELLTDDPDYFQKEFMRIGDILSEKNLAKGLKYPEFAKEEPIEITSVQRNHYVTWGPGGLAQRSGSTEFGVMSRNGSFAIFDGLTGKLAHDCQVPTNQGHSSSSIDFSPKGLHVSVAVEKDNCLFVFSRKKMMLKQKWGLKKNKRILKAKWMDERRILAGLGNGEMLVFCLGFQSPIVKFRLEISIDKWVMDFDFSLDRKTAFLGISSDLVARLSLEKEPGDTSSTTLDTPLWVQRGNKESCVCCVRVSPNEKRVCASTEGKELRLICAETGGLLASFSGFTNPYVYGAVWCLGSNCILGWSDHQITLIKVLRSNGKFFLASNGEVRKLRMGDASICSANVFWGDEESKRKPFVIVGQYQGKCYRVNLNLE